MINPSQVATIIAGAILSGWLFLLGLDSATARPVAASSVAAKRVAQGINKKTRENNERQKE